METWYNILVVDLKQLCLKQSLFESAKIATEVLLQILTAGTEVLSQMMMAGTEVLSQMMMMAGTAMN